MLSGSCLCRTVRYEISGRFYGFVHCHCETCRKIHGTVFGSSALVSSNEFKVLTGNDSVAAYESSPGKERCFCRICGSHVFARFKSRPDIVILRVGTIDSDHRQSPEAHIWVSQRADWYNILDALPQYENEMPGR